MQHRPETFFFLADHDASDHIKTKLESSMHRSGIAKFIICRILSSRASSLPNFAIASESVTHSKCQFFEARETDSLLDYQRPESL
jgi:hypothetical protein